MRYENKVVVVMGGSMGIGFGCVKTFVEDGDAAVVFCTRDADEGQAVAAHPNGRGPGRAHFIQTDVSKVDTPLWQKSIDASDDPGATRAAGDAAQLLGTHGDDRGGGGSCACT
jgi:NAD(P)-dependent dehydrogenase (short-subunit alcohol dehydrogenase family)